MNPEDLGAARFREIAKAREQITETDAALVKARARHEELRRKLTAAELRDREKLGAALVAGKPEPPSEAEKVRAELARQEQRIEALVAALETARQQIPRLVEEHRPAWLRRAYQELGKARSRYEKTIDELEAGRAALDNEATLIAWLLTGDISNAATEALAGRSGSEAISFGRTLAALRDDCEHLAAYPETVGVPVPELRPALELAWTERRWG